MVSDPRCPECTGKVSATATWCMHCGVDFDNPVEADSGAAVDGRATDRAAFDDSEAKQGVKLVGGIVGILAVATLPLVDPPGMLLFVVAAAVGIGIYAARQSTPSEAVHEGGKALAVAPFVLWLLSPLVVGLGNFALGNLFGPLVYAIVVWSVARRFD
jgi:hypothetical protein